MSIRMSLEYNGDLFNTLVERYRDSLPANGDDPWQDFRFYLGMQRWYADTYGCTLNLMSPRFTTDIPDPDVVQPPYIEFESPEHQMEFRLKWL